MMDWMAQNKDSPLPATPAVTRLREDDWTVWRDIRLAALADSPAAFAAAIKDEQTIQEDRWREMVRNAAIFVATAEGQAVGVVAGLYRDAVSERGLGAMWVSPRWRGQGVAGMLVTAVVAWSQSEGATRVGLWVSDDNARARRFYEHQGFRMTGRRSLFPGDPRRFISEMSL